MNGDIYREVKRNFDIKRQKKIDEAFIKKEEIFKTHKILQELTDEMHMLALTSTRNLINMVDIEREIEQENMGVKINKLQEKLDNQLKILNVSIKDLEPDFDCKICKDTGYIHKGDKTSFCNCFTQAVMNTTYRQSNINKLSEENFDTFDIGYYSNQENKEKYGIAKSPLENIRCIKKIAEVFANNIDNPKQKNLLFTGNTGLGKTFLTNCIAKKVIENSKTVVYQTAPILMDKVMEYKFSYDKSGIEKEQYNKIFDVDLLIIDDLGTETMNNNKFTELFNIINTRLLNNKKIIISTNLSLNNLYGNYDERVMSRLIGNFIICKFAGEDIRLKKKRISE